MSGITHLNIKIDKSSGSPMVVIEEDGHPTRGGVRGKSGHKIKWTCDDKGANATVDKFSLEFVRIPDPLMALLEGGLTGLPDWPFDRYNKKSSVEEMDGTVKDVTDFSGRLETVTETRIYKYTVLAKEKGSNNVVPLDPPIIIDPI